MSLEASATWREINAQPDVWTNYADALAHASAEVRDWIKARGIETVWLSGAGSSSFIGCALLPAMGALRLEVRPTTDVVSCPQDHLSAPGRVLSVQFGRSGDSSESIGMMNLLDVHRPDIDRLHITCNPGGALAVRKGPGPGESRALTLPDTTHDVGFAMTVSCTTMLLTACACLTDFDPAALKDLAEEARPLLTAFAAMDAPRPDRVVFLGSGTLTAAARESALKVLELTAGRTMTQWDSPLGYRHGPKAAIDADTHVFVLLHPNPTTARYDQDLADELKRQFPAITVSTIGPGGDFSFKGTGDPRPDTVLYVLAGQVLAARWSAELGLDVDDPFQKRNLTRVVSGVCLHDYVPA